MYMDFLFMMGFDPYFLLLVLPAMIFGVWAQIKVKSSFSKYSNVRVSNGMTGAQAAEAVLRNAGVIGVKIEHTPGNLTDHFDPRGNVIRLSDSVHGASTVAAVGVAAHEAGHAIQHAHGYTPMTIRAAIIPVTNIGSMIFLPLFILGMVLEMVGLMYVAIILFAAVGLFQLVTLPVEFNASNRAIAALEGGGILTPEELRGSKKVLSAAALTYVAALVVSLAQLIRLLAVARRR
jgi:Zn-dependent membrane protease YugP